jgi:sec-independent protein translocase protein TatB
MIGSLGLPEIIFILVLALLIFGPRKLPEIGKTLGRALGEFRRATTDLKRTFDSELSSEEFRSPLAKPAPSKPVSRETTVPMTPTAALPAAEEPPAPSDAAQSDGGTEPTPSPKAE